MANPDSYEIRIGVEDSHWFVGVKPPIPREELRNLGSRVMAGWAVEEFEPTTVFRKYTDASEEATREAINDMESGLKLALLKTGAVVHMKDLRPVDMRGVTSPFDTEHRVGGQDVSTPTA